LSLKGKTYILTRSSSWIGFEISKKVSVQNCRIIISFHKIYRNMETVRVMGTNSVAIEIDIAISSSVLKFVGNLKKDFGRIEILVNISYPFRRKPWFKKLHQLSEIDLASVLNVGLIGSFRLTKEIIKMMLINGVVIIDCSTPAISGHKVGSVYSISKAGLASITKHLALEYGCGNIRASTIALGNILIVATYKFLTKVERRKTKNENAMKRCGKPVEAAKIVAFLASESFSIDTGNTIVADGTLIYHLVD
jgi:3-oxoacyl-[acyl-carrier protein] reductase